jgi:hypothetical protein
MGRTSLGKGAYPATIRPPITRTAMTNQVASSRRPRPKKISKTFTMGKARRASLEL